MKIKVTKPIPVQNPPKIGTVHEVTKIKYEPQRSKRTELYLINYDGAETGIYPHECEVVRERTEE